MERSHEGFAPQSLDPAVSQSAALIRRTGTLYFPRMYPTIHWPTALLIAAGLLVLWRSRTALWRISLLSLPGTLAHELAHWAVGFVLFAQPASFSVWPRRHGNGYVLGSVGFRGVGLLNGAFVALAPILLLWPAYWCLLYSTAAWFGGDYLAWTLWGALAANLVFAAIPSGPDLRLGLPSIALYTVIGTALWWLRALP
ncbi:MAG: hypothetical protein OEL20_05015 [Sulfuritalea sp.]|nr:hypothetical protein [Sulfuritalea sp.]